MVPGKIKGGERLDVPDDGFGYVPGIEQSLVGQCHGQQLHVFAHVCHQHEALTQQYVRELFVDIVLVAEELSAQFLH